MSSRKTMKKSAVLKIALLILALCTFISVSSLTASAEVIGEFSGWVPQPIAGNHPEFEGVSSSKYSMTINKWYEDGNVVSPGRQMSTSDVFKPNRTYVAEVTFKLKNSGDVTASICHGTLNNQEAYSSYSLGKMTYRVAFTLPRAGIYSLSATIVEPVAGQKYSTQITPGNADQYSCIVYRWYVGGTIDSPEKTMSESAVFEAGETYFVDIQVRAKDGYDLFNPAKPAIINSKTSTPAATNSLAGTTIYYYRVAYTIPSKVTYLSVDVADVKAHNTADAGIAPDDASKYFASVEGWYKGGTLTAPTNPTSSGETFVAGNKYIVVVKFVAKDGYVITASPTVSINMMEGTLYKTNTLSDGQKEYLYTAEFTAAPEQITSVKATVSSPAPENSPTYNASAYNYTESLKYTVAISKWYNGGTVTSPGTLMTSTSKFTYGQTYICEVVFTPKTGYIFSDKPSATVSGITATYYTGSGYSGTRTYRFAITSKNKISFQYSSAFDVPSGNVGTRINNINVKSGLSGTSGEVKYTKVSGPSWLSMDVRGILVGTRPTTPSGETTAVYTATDATGDSVTFMINVGAVMALPVTNFNITGLTAPAAGVAMDYAAAVSQKGFTVSAIIYYTDTNPATVLTNYTPKAGDNIVIGVRVKADDGYCFGSSNSAIWNGIDSFVTVHGSLEEENERRFHFKYTVPTPQIAKADLFVTQPAANAIPSNSAIADVTTYNVSSVSWDPSASTFAAGKAYTVIITLEGKAGARFTYTPSVTVNGKTAKIISGAGSEELRISYTFPATVSAAKPSITSQPVGGSFTIGDTVKLTVGAKSTDGGTLTYQWYRTSVNEISTIIAIPSGSTSSTFVPQQTVGTAYYCVMVTNEKKEGGKVVASNFVYSNLVAVTFNEKAATVEGIEILNKPTKLEYIMGETLNTSGMTVRVVMSDGYKNITSGFTCSPMTLNTVGTQKITVTYQGKTASFDVTVKDSGSGDLDVSGIEIFNLPKKIVYTKGETFQPDGLVIKIILAEGGWLQGNNFKDMTFSPATLNTAGTQKITVTYKGKTTSFNVTVGDTPHIHSFGSVWKNDDSQHWHECACGEKSDLAAHTYGEWETVKEATETEEGSKKRVCSVCGYEEYEAIPVIGSESTATSEPTASDTTPIDPEKPDDSFPWWIIVVALVAIAGIATVIIILVRKNKNKTKEN